MKLIAKSVVVALAVAWSGAALAQAQSKPNFTGAWVAVSGPGVGEEMFIKHDATSITIGHDADASNPHHSQTFKLDGVAVKQPNLAHHDEMDITQASWQGEKLVIVVRAAQGGPQHRRVLSLQSDGMLLMEVTLTLAGKSEETIKATFKRKPGL